jgi:hypothetical protein
MKSFFVVLSLIALSAALPASKREDVNLSEEDMKKVLEAVRKALPTPELPPEATSKDILKLAENAIAGKKMEAAQLANQDEEANSDDVVTTLVDIVKTDTDINGMNDLAVDATDVANTGVGIGEVEVMVGSSGDTVRTEIGDLTNVMGAIQGFWYNYEIANVNVRLQ